jgi:ribosomal protein S18 acetylase RimI-like enzyme
VVTNFEIRAMTAADVGAACELARAQGWRDRRRFYDSVLRTSTCQPLVGTIDDRLVATGLGTVSLPVGWIGAIAVSAEQRRQGLGRAMTEEICQRLQTAGCATLSLEATDAGRPMYERMGFRLATYYHQLQADHLAEAPPPPEGSRVRRLERADLPDVFALDRQATGEDRHVALEILTRDGGWMLEHDDGPCGFLLPAERAYGAIVAPRFKDGLFLLDLHRSVTPEGGHVRAGIPDEHAAAWQELRTRGWQETWRAPRMLLGPDVNWRPEWIWGQINSAMG